MAPVSQVELTESSPRDGLQSLGEFVPTEAKVGLINDLAGAGLATFDAVSFVNPRSVPQMADAVEVVEGARRDDIVLGGLVPNLTGLEAAVAAGVDGIAVLTAASDTFNQRNINATVEESMDRIQAVLDRKPGDLPVRGYISTATHCPYEGPTDPNRVAELAQRLLEWGVDEVYLGDTTGEGTVADVARLLGRVLDRIHSQRIGMHFHDTYGQALANVALALEHGIFRFDSSAGGLGGCPYAPGAAGNVATEDILWMLDGMGIEHGIDIHKVAAIADQFCRRHRLRYRSRAGEALLAAQERAR